MTADRQTRLSEATTGEPIDDTLLDTLELDLSGPRRTGSDIAEGQVGINATPVHSDEEPSVRFAATQQNALILCVVVDEDLGSSQLDVPGLVERRDVRPRRGNLKTPDDSTSPQKPETVPVRPSSVEGSGVGASIFWVHSTIQTKHWAWWLSCGRFQFFLGFQGGSRWHTMEHIPIRWRLQDPPQAQ